jgi:hypothetical protein
MSQDIDSNIFISKIQEKGDKFATLFCILCAERMTDIYKKFSEKYEFRPEYFDEVINLAYGFIVCFPSEESVKNLRQEIFDRIPDSEEFPDVQANQAQCAASSLVYALDFLVKKNKADALFAIDMVGEAIDIYGFEKGEEKSKELCKKERECRVELCELINNLNDIYVLDIEKLRKLNSKYWLPVID